MEQRSIFLGTTVISLVALAAVLGIYYAAISVGQPVPSYGQDSTDKEKNILSVSGTGVAGVEPDRVKIQMAVVAEGDTAELAATRNAERFNTVLAALLDEGIPRDQIETMQYTIYPVYDYSERTQRLTGYRVTHSIQVTVISTASNGLGKIAGNIIDVVVSAGVNQINSVQFTTSQETIKSLRSEALKDAVSDARMKADALTEALGVTIIGISQVSESSFIPTPGIYRDFAAEAAPGMTELVPGELKVTASVHITYEISQ